MTLSHVPTNSHSRLLRMAETADSSGEPLIAILPPGARAVPVVFRTMKAALAALQDMEGAR